MNDAPYDAVAEWYDKYVRLPLYHGVTAPAVSAYFGERFWQAAGSAGVHVRVGEYHRTLRTYIDHFIETGFTLGRLVEPRAEGERADQVLDNRDAPSVLLMRWAKRDYE